MANRIVDVKYATLHEAFNFQGKNFEKTLDGLKYAGIGLQYDKDDKELLISWSGETMYMPHTNVKGYVPGKLEGRKVLPITHAMVAGISTSAQVETPQGHVHAGLGKGKTGK